MKTEAELIMIEGLARLQLDLFGGEPWKTLAGFVIPDQSPVLAFLKANGWGPKPVGQFYDLGWSDAIEAAAKVAENFPAHTHGSLATAPPQAAEQAADEIATAIRALKTPAGGKE